MENKPDKQDDSQPNTTPQLPDWRDRISPKAFNIACLVLGLIMLVTGIIAGLNVWRESGTPAVGVIVMGCGALMTFMGITGLRDMRKKGGK